MNHCPIKILSVFIISVFLISTITIISSPTLTTENSLSVQKGSQNISITSTLSGRNDNITNTKPQQLLGNTNQMKLDPAVATNYDNSLSSSNKLPNLQSEQLTNPLFNNFMYQNKFASTGVQTLTPPGEPLQTTGIQTITSIKQWNTLTQNDETGLQSIKTLYPSDLLVKVDTNNNVEFVVKMKDMSQVSSLNLLFSTYNIRIEDQVSSLASLVVWVPLRNLNVFLQQTAITTNIAFVEPNSYVHVQYVPNDPYWSEQYAPQLIGMPTAWDQARGSRSIKVAVIDTGIDYTHPDLVNNYLPIGYNWLANNSNPMDDNGHGTHVAGTIAAAINNGIGIAGLANVSVFAEKFLDSNGYGSDINAALAINHAVAVGAKILSNSWGGIYNSSLIADAVANAISKGVMVVAAAGNLGTNLLPSFPADLPGVIGVAATDSYDQQAYFSNYGDYVDISAPGVGILSTYLNNSYAYLSGTSMATPHVSGLAALLMSKYPSDTATQIENIIYNTAVDLGTPGWDPYYGWGRIDAGSAIFGLQAHNLRAYINTPSVFPVSLSSTFNVSIRNIGLNTESNITYTVLENNTQINNGIIPTLLTGITINIPITILPATLDTYNLTLIVNPVPEENVIADNIAMRMVRAVTKQIDMHVGDILAYNNYNPLNSTGSLFPFDSALNITAQISPTTYNVSYLLYFSLLGQVEEITLLTFLVNSYTREVTNGLWGIFPYWINTTGLKTNDAIDLFTKGGHEGTVIGNSIYNYYGVTIPTIIINNTVELLVFDQNTGVLLADNNLNNTPYFVTSFTNVYPAGFDLHNSKGQVIDVYGAPNTTAQICFLVLNTGSYSESSTVALYLNNAFMISYNFNLNPGQYQFFNASWTPMIIGNFSLNLRVSPGVNETYLVDNYVNATAFSIDTYIVVNVRDGSSTPSQPVSGAKVGVYDYYTYNLIDSGYTDENGIYQTKDLISSLYTIQVNASGYYTQTYFIYINPPRGIINIYFYLYPLPQRSIQIISPSNGSTNHGGLVNINYKTSDMFNIQSISIYVNNKYVGTTHPSSYSFDSSTTALVIPVFRNGTNTILLSFLWFDSSKANTTIIIHSIDVFPTFYPQPGDFLSYSVSFNHSTNYNLENFTFGNWISSTEINVTYSFGRSPYFNTTWFPVNILNGFINDSFYIANGYMFFFFSNLGYTNPNGHGSIGDKIPFNAWSNILTVIGITWTGTNVWTLTDNITGDNFYFSRLTGILMYAHLNYELEEISLLSTSFPLIAPAPTINGSSKITYEVGTSGHNISWNISGTYPDVYTIMRNGSLVATGKWIPGVIISQNIDGLTSGTYIYILIAYNVGGWTNTNKVFIYVVPTSTKSASGFDIAILLSAFATIATLSLYYKKSKRLHK